MKKERNYLFDNLKLFLIILVVYGHILGEYTGKSGVIKSVFIFIYFFHMPLFIFVSGFFSKNIEKVKKDSIKDLLMPYIVFNILLSIYQRNINFNILQPGWTMWYLLSLFFWRYFFKYVIKMRYVVLISFIVALLIGGVNNIGTYLSLSRTIAFLPFFLLGYYTKDEHLKRLKSYPIAISIIGLVLSFLIAVVLGKYKQMDLRLLYLAHPYKIFKITFLTGVLYRLTIYIIMLLSSIFIIRLIPDKKLNISRFGENTMNVYLGHIYFIKTVVKITPRYTNKVTFFIVTLVVSIGIVLILSLPIFERIYNYFFLRERQTNRYREEQYLEMK